jgi:hypothetical protein
MLLDIEWNQPSGDVVDRLLRQAWKRQKMLMELKEKDDEEFYRTNTFSPSISPYSKSLKHSEPVHERLFKIHRIQVAAGNFSMESSFYSSCSASKFTHSGGT